MKYLTQKTLLTTTMIAALLASQVYAQKYLIIGSDSNNCQLHHTPSGKSYVTGFDCTCMAKSSEPKDMQWVISFGETRPLGCYPDLETSYHNHHVAHERPIDCEKGDHCTQYGCLELLYDDNKLQPEHEMTVPQSACIDEEHQPLMRCDQNGRNCVEKTS